MQMRSLTKNVNIVRGTLAMAVAVTAFAAAACAPPAPPQTGSGLPDPAVGTFNMTCIGVGAADGAVIPAQNITGTFMVPASVAPGANIDVDLDLSTITTATTPDFINLSAQNVPTSVTLAVDNGTTVAEPIGLPTIFTPFPGGQNNADAPTLSGDVTAGASGTVTIDVQTLAVGTTSGISCYVWESAAEVTVAIV